MPQDTPETALTRRINASARPSRVINRLYATEQRCAAALKILKALIDRAPRLRDVTLITTLDRTVQDYWEHLAHGSWLSRRERWAQQSKEVFAAKAWLAHEQYRLSASGFALVQQLVDAPSAQARADAGGAWGNVQVADVMWPYAAEGHLAIPGALYLHRQTSGPHVLYVPGMRREFHEFASRALLLCELPALIGEPLVNDLWKCLPLRRYRREAPPQLICGPLLAGDALRHSALAVLDAQWSNERACVASIKPDEVGDMARFMRFIERGRKRLVMSTGLADATRYLLEWDRQRRSAEITFASLASGLALRTREQAQERREKALASLMGADGAYQVMVALQAQRTLQVKAADKLLEAADAQLFQQTFWLQRTGTHTQATQFLKIWQQALVYETRLQQRLKLIREGPSRRVLEVLDHPLAAKRTGSDTCVLRVTVGIRGQTFYRLMGVFVVTTARARRQPGHPQPVALVMLGGQGGLQGFSSLQDLSARLQSSLQSPDGSPLWQCIERDNLAAVRLLMKASPAFEYTLTEGNVLHECFREWIKYYIQLHQRLGENVRVYSEVSDPALGKLLLAGELREQLRVNDNPAFTLAFGNVELVRFAAEQASKLPGWLSTATAPLRKEFRRLQNRYLANTLAIEERLWQVLPSLDQYAREVLIARLTADGVYTGLDIDAPFIDVPDDVSAHFCGWSSQCAVGDRHIKKMVSPQRSSFSLLQLALNNLDAQAPWTEWRLNRAQYLQPAWKARLSPAYLIKTLAALDIGGRYDTLIKHAFYPANPQDGLAPALVKRAVVQQARMQLFSAARQGLSAAAQSLFNTAMAATTPGDLLKNGHQVQLCHVRLEGHTLEHHRHIAGMLVIHDELSQRCVLYWPAATDFAVISEYASWREARLEMNRTLSTQAKNLAQHVAPGWEAQAVASYPGAPPAAPDAMAIVRTLPRALLPNFHILQVGEAIARFVRSFKVKHRLAAVALDDIQKQIQDQIDTVPPGWLDIVATTHCNAAVLLGHARMFEVQRRAQARSNASELLTAYREERLGEQRGATIRGVLSFVPVLGLGISLLEVLLAARRYHHNPGAHEAVDLAFVTLMAFVDVLTSFAPVPKGSAASSLARGSARGALVHLHRRPAMGRNSLPILKPQVLKPLKALEHLRKERATGGVVALQGPGNKGSFVKDGEQFVVEDIHQYTVYRRDNEPLLRLKNTEGQNELILHIEEPGEWLLQADAPAPPVDAPQPQAGPSTGIWQPWTRPADIWQPWAGPAREAGEASTSRVPVPVAGTGWSPPSRSLLEQALRDAPTGPNTWHGWGVRPTSVLDDVLPTHGVYREPAGGRALVKLGAEYYRLLPEGGNASWQSVIFLMKDQPLRSTAALDIEHWAGAGMADQPVPATLGADGAWATHPVLFREPLNDTLAHVFPSLSEASRRFVGQRLIDLADPTASATATHLLNVRATLDHWLTSVPLGHTDDLLKMLRPVQGSSRVNFYVGHDGVSPGFTRVDFAPPFPLDPLLALTRRDNMKPRATATQAAVRQVLEQQGFVVHAIGKKPGWADSIDFFATHPASGNGYYILTRWMNNNSLNLGANPYTKLSDQWFHHGARRRGVSSTHPRIMTSLKEGRLVRIAAGIQWAGQSGPTVYFVKFEGLIP